MDAAKIDFIADCASELAKRADAMIAECVSAVARKDGINDDFKRGDKVICQGKEGVVTGVDHMPHGDLVFVKFEDRTVVSDWSFNIKRA